MKLSRKFGWEHIWVIERCCTPFPASTTSKPLYDRALSWMFPESTRTLVAATAPGAWSSVARSSASWFLVGLVAFLSTPVVRNMASKKQSMNRTFEPLRIVNTYGAFGSVSKVRGGPTVVAPPLQPCLERYHLN